MGPHPFAAPSLPWPAPPGREPVALHREVRQASALWSGPLAGGARYRELLESSDRVASEAISPPE
jgi:hypothetical protein